MPLVAPASACARRSRRPCDAPALPVVGAHGRRPPSGGAAVPVGVVAARPAGSSAPAGREPHRGRGTPPASTLVTPCALSRPSAGALVPGAQCLHVRAPFSCVVAPRSPGSSPAHSPSGSGASTRATSTSYTAHSPRSVRQPCTQRPGGIWRQSAVTSSPVPMRVMSVSRSGLVPSRLARADRRLRPTSVGLRAYDGLPSRRYRPCRPVGTLRSRPGTVWPDEPMASPDGRPRDASGAGLTVVPTLSPRALRSGGASPLTAARPCCRAPSRTPRPAWVRTTQASRGYQPDGAQQHTLYQRVERIAKHLGGMRVRPRRSQWNTALERAVEALLDRPSTTGSARAAQCAPHSSA